MLRGSEKVGARWAVYSSGGVAMLFHALIICACIPPVTGAASLLASLYVVRLSSSTNLGSDVVEIGYLGICVVPENSEVSCVTTVSRSSSTIISKLRDAPNIDALKAINSGLELQRQVFQCVPILSGILLFGSVFFVFITRFVAKRAYESKKQVARQHVIKKLQSWSQWLALLATTFSLVSAYSITQSMAALVTVARTMVPDLAVSRGEVSLALHWTSFVVTLSFMAGLKLITSSTQTQPPRSRTVTSEEESEAPLTADQRRAARLARGRS